MTRRRTVIITVAGLLTAAGLATGLTASLSGSSPGKPGHASIRPTTSMLTPQQRTRLEQGIMAPTIAAQATVVAAELRTQFVSRGRPLLPLGSRLHINAASFHVTSSGIAIVNAVVSGRDPGHWQLLLIREGGQWLLIDSRKQP